MSHVLPALGSATREMFDMQSLVDVSEGRTPVHCHRPALRKAAEKAFAATPAAKRMIYFYVDPSNDQLQLVSIGKRGGFKVEWTFGTVTRQTRLA